MKFFRPVLVVMTLFFLPALAPQAGANPDEGLYDPLPPEGSAFLRFIYDYEDKGSEKAIANGKTYDYVEFKEISSYFVVPGGKVDVAIGDKSESFEAEPGKFYTAILTDDNRLEVKTDTPNENRAKAQISFYNLSDEDGLSVKTSDNKVEIISPTAPEENAAREINPVKVSLGVFQGDKMIKDLGDLSLVRSVSYSIVAYNKDNIEWVQSTTNTAR